MQVFAKVKPNSKEERVEKSGRNEFVLRVRAAAKEGKANAAVIELLSEYFDVAKSKVIILKGQKSKNKIISIEL